jgi:putative tryptophan/tyrosine transport system substrate-binding protein
MRRREFIAGLGAAAWPVVARAQQPALPVIGYLSSLTSDRLGAEFRQGLSQHGYIEGRNVEIVYRRAETRNDRLPALAAELVSRRVFLDNPTLDDAETRIREVETAARVAGVHLAVANARTPSEIEKAFTMLVEQRIGALLESGDPLFSINRVQLVALAARHGVPAIYANRDSVESGGLVSYGPNLPDAWRLAGTYAGRILKGEKPADLPVQQPTKFELVINLKTAKALGLTVPETLLATADEEQGIF